MEQIRYILILLLILSRQQMNPSKFVACVFLIIILLLPTITQQIQNSNGLDAKYVPKKPKKNNSQYSTILGFIVGPIMFVLSFVGVWFNEKRAAVNYSRLKLAESMLQNNSQPVQYDLDNLKTQLNSEKKLIHRTGVPEIIEPARDEQCLVFPPDAISIYRKVQVKEVRANTKRRSNQQEIQYKLQWVSENIQECEAESNSPLKWFIKSSNFYAPQIKLSGYYMNESQISQLQCDSVIQPYEETFNALSYLASQVGSTSQPIFFNDYLYFPAQDRDVESKGSLRVKFFYCRNTQLSIICSLDNYKQTFQPFRIDLVDNKGVEDTVPCQQAQCCMCCGKLAQMLKPMSEMNLIVKGNYNSDDMIELSIKKNKAQTNILRIVFFVLMVLGICVFFSPIVEVIGYLPLVGGFLKATTGIIVFLAAFLVSIPLFAIVFGLSWLRYHPVIGGSALGVAALILIAFQVM